MRRILITGANKGIGLALLEAISIEHPGTLVYLGSRDEQRGRAAAKALLEKHPGMAGRIDVVGLDVASPSSVARARQHVADSAGGEPLYAIVNNAGIGDDNRSLAEVLETNTLGVQRVCEAFLPLLEPNGGRVVNVTSAAGPMFVASCSPERQRFFLDPAITWPALQSFIEQCLAHAHDRAALAALGLGSSAYGLSKACANSFTLLLARENPRLSINACTPGFIATDMGRRYAEAQGKTPAELGMKTPAEGTRAPLHLLFGTLAGSGNYYGSDAKRSPLDRYRAPGSPEYTG